MVFSKMIYRIVPAVH